MTSSAQGSQTLLLLHGFAQGPSSWQSVLDRLGQSYNTIVPELRGHGATGLSKGAPTLQGVLEDLVEVIASHPARSVAVWGYSQGARIALSFALAHPQKVSAVILESGSAGINDQREREHRLADDRRLAHEIESQPIETFVKQWEQNAIFSNQSAELIALQRPARLANQPDALAAALRGLGQGEFDPVWGRLGNLMPPVLLLTGSLDARYSDIAAEMQRQIPNAEHIQIEGVGHAVHLERPDACADAISEFLARTTRLPKT